jgi:amphi-Trp domain-containing protein
MTENEDSPDSETEASDHALPEEKLNYPEFVFEDGTVDEDGAFDLSQELSREEMAEWLRDLADGLESHDVAVESPDGHVTFGVGAERVSMSFEPDENYRGTLTATFDLKSKAMFVADDPTKPKAGARGGKGFIPLSMLTSDRETFRCYNWIDNPKDP